jgi:hypothetical protein
MATYLIENISSNLSTGNDLTAIFTRSQTIPLRSLSLIHRNFLPLNRYSSIYDKMTIESLVFWLENTIYVRE